MAATKQFVVIGLGSFGAALAARLSKNGCRVTGLDASRQRVEDLKDKLYEAVIGNASDRDTLQHLPLTDAYAVFIALGEDMAQSLLATLHVKELGARHIVVKGLTREHGKILESLGVRRVVFPEVEIAETLADRMTWPNVIDFLPIDPEFSFMEVAVPDSFVGKTLTQLQLRQRCGVWIVGVKDVLTGKLQMFPDGDYQIGPDQLFLVVGKQQGLDKLRELR